MGAKRRWKAPTVRVYATIEKGHYDKMRQMMREKNEWVDEAAFVRDAILDKIRAREPAGEPGATGPVPGSEAPKVRSAPR